MSRFQIQTHALDAPCVGCAFDGYRDADGRPAHRPECPFPTSGRTWTPMEDGPAGSVWKPRPSAQEAALKAHTWTGGMGIPAMRVVDLETGDVVWQHAYAQTESGRNIHPAWHDPINAAALTDDDEAHAEALRRAMLMELPPASTTADQGALF